MQLERSEALRPHTTTGLAGVTDEAYVGGALEGTRTPNLLIRR